ncbi:MAG: hypothetical protein OXH97_05145 [Chloroflexota bacterium]|nr:hypothetical protein [Chloroflexota bacterium]
MTSDAPTQRLYVEFEGDEACPVAFEGDSTIVLFFASWAYSVRFGGQHELAQAAMRMQRRFKVELRPLLRYADRDVEDTADQRELDRAWQDPAPLAECCRAVTAAIAGGDEELDGLLDGYDELAPRLTELAEMCDWAAGAEARVRLSFDLRPEED